MAGNLPLPQQQAPASAASSSATADEEAFKRNTDCVYFLASPLTCKKGSECEYRHSEMARVNPRDCWYWMHGNCLNPKCAFRHPPLEGLFGTQAPAPTGVPLPQSQAAIAPVAPASLGTVSGRPPCVFFQKGYCMKGDWCPFLHSQSLANHKVLPSQAPVITMEPPTLKKTFGGSERLMQEKISPPVTILKIAELPSQAKTVPRVESARGKNEFFKETKHLASSISSELRDVPPVDNGSQVSRSSRVQQPLLLKDNIGMNSKDAEEISREPSPGFDVLVDNELGDSMYYPTEDHFGRPDDCDRGNEYFDSNSGDYRSVDADRDMYRDSHNYDSYGRQPGQYAREQRRSSSGRMLGGLFAHRERDRNEGAVGPDEVSESDLRYHLSKHTRNGGLRSVINQDYTPERIDYRGHQNSHKDLHHDHERHRNPISNRLQGRIKMPGPSDDGNELLVDRSELQRTHSGLSQQSSHLSSRLKNRLNNDHRSNRSLPIRRETKSEDNVNFAGPKSLSELKSRRTVDTNDEHSNYQASVGKRKYSMIEYPQHAESNLSFDGPKPLEEILKRKRGSEKAVSGINNSSDGKEFRTPKVREESSMNHAVTEQQSPSKNGFFPGNEKENVSKSTSGVKFEKEAALSSDGQSFFPPNHNEAEVDGEMRVEDGAEDQDAEHCGHEDDEYYDQADGGAYDLDEGDIGDPEGEYLEDDDEDFAKKMGVMY